MTKRRGRKRKVNVRRESNGRELRLPALEREADTVSVVMEARIRVHGVFKSEARRKEAGYALGRAWMKGELTAPQVEAAERFQAIRRDYESAILAKTVFSPSDLDRKGGHDGRSGDDEAYVARCIADERAFKEARRALLNAGPLVPFAVEVWVIDDKEVWSVIGDLRLGLNALVRLYRIECRGIAA